MLLSPPQLGALAEAYSAVSGRLSSRVLLSTSLPAVESVAVLTKATSRYLVALHSAADGVLGETGEGREAEGAPRGLELRAATAAVVAQVWPGCERQHLAFDLFVSHRQHLTVPHGRDLAWGKQYGDSISRLELNELESERLTQQLADGHVFDGLLPRLSGHYLSRDAASGRLRLVLSTAACSYSAVILDHYAGREQVARSGSELRPRGISTTDVRGDRVGLLTLALAPVTSDGYILFGQRSHRAGSHEGLIGPAVNGNLELASRHGRAEDLDHFGTPDPLLALVREAREELGLMIERDRIYAAGLGTFTTTTEVASHVFVAYTVLDQSLSEVVDGLGGADLLEGRWEVGQTLTGMRLPPTSVDGLADPDLGNRVDWLLGHPRMTPHAVFAGLCALAIAMGNETLLTEAAGRTEIVLPENPWWLAERHIR